MSTSRNNGNGGDESESSACEAERVCERDRRRRGVTDKRTEWAFIVTEEAGTIKTLDFFYLLFYPRACGFIYH